MGKTLIVVVAVLIGMASAFGQGKPAASAATPSPEPYVRKLWEAFKNKDKATLSTLLDDNFRMFEEGLTTFGDKKAEVNAPDEYELVSYTLSDFVIKPISPDAALVTYNAQYEGKSGGEVQKGKSVFGEVWIRSGGKWKSLYLQETYMK